MLRPGGRFAVSDIVVGGAITQDLGLVRGQVDHAIDTMTPRAATNTTLDFAA